MAGASVSALAEGTGGARARGISYAGPILLYSGTAWPNRLPSPYSDTGEVLKRAAPETDRRR
jgi:hypothetical protein